MSIFEDNCQFLEEYLPYGADLVSKLRAVAKDSFHFEGAGESLNLTRDGKKVYAGGILEYAKQDVTKYLNDPTRFYIMTPIVQIEKGKIASRFREALYEHVGDWGYHETPTSDAGYAVVFGLGVGAHLNFLASYLPVEHFIFAESDLVQFRACCDVFSWRQFITHLENSGKKVSLYVTSFSEQLGNAVMNEMRDEFHVFLDGSYFYQHSVDPDGSLAKARLAFDQTLVTLEYSMGFFEDECLMFKNTMANLANVDFHLMPKTPFDKAGLPAMIVGSGPSVDGAIDTIRNNADKALLFSGGTSYSVLKRNGITPDFHTQYENDVVNYDVVTSFAKDFTFDDTYLIAPMTIDPRIPPFFKGVLFYFRDSLSPTMLLANDEQIMTQSGPTVSNLGCRSAISMGAEALILFGVDLGGPSEEDHHSKDTIYIYEKDIVAEHSGELLGDLPDTTPQRIPVAGTYCDTVYTNRIFMQAKMYFEGLFQAFSHVPVFNCSIGAKIIGVSNVLPE